MDNFCSMYDEGNLDILQMYKWRTVLILIIIQPVEQFDAIKINLIYLGCEFIIYFAITILIDVAYSFPSLRSCVYINL